MRGKLLYLATLVAVIGGCTLLGGPGGDIRVGQPAPPTEGIDGDGQFFQLTDYPGRVVMLSFWGNFCGPCRALFPHERSLLEKYRDKPFVLLGVNADVDSRELKQVQGEGKVIWRSWWDGPAGPIVRHWGVFCFPTVFLIDHHGVIRYRSDGAPDAGKLDALIEQMVREVSSVTKE